MSILNLAQHDHHSEMFSIRKQSSESFRCDRMFEQMKMAKEQDKQSINQLTQFTFIVLGANRGPTDNQFHLYSCGWPGVRIRIECSLKVGLSNSPVVA